MFVLKETQNVKMENEISLFVVTVIEFIFMEVFGRL